MIDITFSTAKDMIFAQIIGNTLTINYLKKKVSRKKRKPFVIKQKKSPLKWTGTKVDLVELVYALQASGMINNGQANLADLATAFETLFQKDMTDFYRVFLEIRNRKSNQSKLLDLLKRSLLQRIIEIDA
ncbi:RteC domain-containing protein [Aequorivita lipolytica]|uniref:RteC protein n=1 Tax=Aequorivita lipolytica TaxID=153267 RepID=A0A5C6YP09_9FLAO|nr:RteC domain-containing protein [Aequorivita lipolytica]TXD68957.1 hypothetical protein ESV24_09385 [Aequorivita lipolytica]SRX53066.1 hypothetical protein AEQU2_02296 [Aequorivita lipolytica]